MNLAVLGALYALVGVGCAAARLASGDRAPAGRGGRAGRLADAALLLALWPLLGPFLLLRGDADADAGGPHAEREVAFLVALRRAADTPLGTVLPDPDTARALAGRLRVAAAKVAEIDDILAQPAFDEADARARIRQLRDRGASACAQSTAAMRLHNIGRLRALRDRFARELDEVGELLVQLTTQAEVLRLAGGHDESSAELVRELVSRVEGLDEMLDDDHVLA